MNYKGFEIQAIYNFDHETPERFFVPTLEKNYATESAAKVGITKYIKQNNFQTSEEIAQAVKEAAIILPSQETLDSPSIPVPTGLSREETRQFIIAHAEKPQQSRNKREGFFSGLYNGSVCRLPLDTYHDGKKCVWSNSDKPKNRKQRKAFKIAERHFKAFVMDQESGKLFVNMPVGV